MQIRLREEKTEFLVRDLKEGRLDAALLAPYVGSNAQAERQHGGLTLVSN